MTVDDLQKALLYIVLEREARGEGLEGMRAVAHVINNRLKAGWGTWFEIIEKHNQFSSMTVPGDSQLVWWPASYDNALGEVIEAIYVGTDSDPTNGALYYADETHITSQWYVENIIAKLPVKAVIGRHTFR